MTVDEFVQALCALPWPKVPDRAGLRQYYRYLNNEPLSHDQLDSVYKLLTDGGHYFPLPGELKQAVRTVRAQGISDPIWQTWRDEHGRPYARKVQDPGRMPEPPEGVEASNLVVPESMQFNENQICGPEADAAFKKGFVEAGGNLAEFKKYLALVKR